MGDYVIKYTCGTCKYYEYAGQDNKGYCNYYRSYYYHNDSCNHWEENEGSSSGSSGCFLTTACCEYHGLPDDCEELSVMRKFRDDFLMKNQIGAELVHSYYKIAPEIVEKINEKENREDIYRELFNRIQNIVKLIKDSLTDEAVAEYVKMLMYAQKSCT